MGFRVWCLGGFGFTVCLLQGLGDLEFTMCPGSPMIRRARLWGWGFGGFGFLLVWGFWVIGVLEFWGLGFKHGFRFRVVMQLIMATGTVLRIKFRAEFMF